MIKPWLAFFGGVIWLMVNVGCTTSTDSDPNLPLANPEPQAVEKQNQMDGALAGLQIQFDEKYNGYSGGDKVFDPCQDDLTSALRSAQVEATSLVSDLDKSAQAHGYVGEKGYREKAVGFYRRAKARAESLAQLNSEISAYCQYDQASVLVCLNQSGSVKVYLNRNLAGYARVQALVQPGAQSKTFLYALSDETNVRAKLVPNGEDADASPLDVMPENTTLAELRKESSCLTGAGFNNDLAKQITRSLGLALSDGADECDSLKAQVASNSISMSAAENRFCGVQK